MEKFIDPSNQRIVERVGLKPSESDNRNSKMTDEEWAAKMIEAGISPEEIKNRIEARNKDRA